MSSSCSRSTTRTVFRAFGLIVLLNVAGGARTSQAQIDYRNLDDDRPVLTEDAYPVERYAFELQLPYAYERRSTGTQLHASVLELTYGLFANGQVGLHAPIAVQNEPSETAQWGLAGLRPFALYNFNTERASLPALALRADVSLPIGALAGDNVQLTVKGIATRSWGATRMHVNASRSLGSRPGRLPAVEAANRWVYSAAVDRTLLRKSMLLLGEIAAVRAIDDADPVEWTVAVGTRYQFSPTLVVDAGLRRRLRATGPDIGLTLGVSHAFAVGAFMPSVSH